MDDLYKSITGLDPESNKLISNAERSLALIGLVGGLILPSISLGNDSRFSLGTGGIGKSTATALKSQVTRIDGLTSINNERKILSILDSFSEPLPFDTSIIRSLTLHREWGEAFDILCTQLFEYDVKVSSTQYLNIKAVGESMGMDEPLWKDLNPNS